MGSTSSTFIALWRRGMHHGHTSCPGYLRRYLVKHGPRTDLEVLDFEAIDKEIEANEAVQAAQTVAATDEDPSVPEKGENDAPTA